MSRAVQRWIFLIFLALGTIYYFFHIRTIDGSYGIFGESEISADWSKIKQTYPVPSFHQVPIAKPETIPSIQATQFPETEEQKTERLARLQSVKAVFQRSWKAYHDNAWLHDEFTPLTMAWKDHFGGWGATLVDSLDTMLIMGMDKEFLEAMEAVRAIKFSTTHVKTINVFETTIRFLGGFLAAHDIANGRDGGLMLQKAQELGEMLYHAFDTANRMPVTRWYWQHTAAGVPQEPHPYTLAAELASMTLEFTRLSQLTGDPKYYDAVQRVSNVLENEQHRTKLPGLWPVVFNAKTLSFGEDSLFTLGGRADSMYEYIPKTHLLLGAATDQYRNMYTTMMDVAKEYLFFKPMNKNNLDILISGSVQIDENGEVRLKPEGQHLSCFVGGLVAIGSKVFERPDDLEVGRKLTEGCVWAYESTETGIMPEIFMTVPPSTSNKKNKWDRTRWLDGVNEIHVVAGEDEIKDHKARAEKIVDALRLPEGITGIPDRRYILR
jgi:mannosyl-oligosaccharide alpha-1,2-mannosidase